MRFLWVLSLMIFGVFAENAIAKRLDTPKQLKERVRRSPQGTFIYGISNEPGHNLKERVRRSPQGTFIYGISNEPGHNLKERVRRSPQGTFIYGISNEPGHNLKERVRRSPQGTFIYGISNEPGHNIAGRSASENVNHLEAVDKVGSQEYDDVYYLRTVKRASGNLCMEDGKEKFCVGS